MIIDASVAFKWIANEDGSDRALALLEEEALVAPYLLLSEVGNGLRRQIKAGQLSSTDALLADLGRLPTLITLIDESADVPVALDLATTLDHSVYDCVYLAMAIRRDVVLVTADSRFARKLAGTAHVHRVREL